MTYTEHDSSRTDADIAEMLTDKGLEDSILQAAIYAIRNDQFAYLIREYNRLAGPVIDAAAQDAELQSQADAADARFVQRMERAA
jgi:hypothetical protein